MATSRGTVIVNSDPPGRIGTRACFAAVDTATSPSTPWASAGATVASERTTLKTKCSYIRIVGDEPSITEHHRSAFVSIASITAIIDGDRCVTIHTIAGVHTLTSANPTRHARDLIRAIAAATDTDDFPETVFFTPTSNGIEAGRNDG
jgi:hypothetical protein